MILSGLQLALLAQLWQSRDSAVDCYNLVNANTKTLSFGKLLESEHLISIGPESIVVDVVATQAKCVEYGIIDDAGELTELGQSYIDMVIIESLQAMFLHNRAKRH
jgi:hypothetical protein